MGERWQIRYFGGLRAERGPLSVTEFRTQKGAALLAWLALSPGQRHPREVLIEMLWPEMLPASGRNNLSRALSALRQRLEPPGIPSGSVLDANRAEVWIEPGAVATDLAAFRAAVDRAERAEEPGARRDDLERAASLYRGEFLPGLYLDWVVATRAQLEEERLRVLLDAAVLHAEAGDRRESLRWALEASAIAPLAEEPVRLALRLSADLGEPAAGLRSFRALCDRLDRELGFAPTAETRALAAELARLAGEAPVRPSGRVGGVGDVDGAARAPTSPTAPTGPPPPTAPTASSPPSPPPRPSTAPATPAAPAAARPAAPRVPRPPTRFFGREGELDRLLASVGGGPAASRLVTVTGMPGAGKTRLALEAGHRLLAERADLAGRVWFSALADVPEAGVLTRLASTFGLRPASADLDAIAAALGPDQPALLILDNAEHVADAAARAVGGLLERAPGLAILVTSQRHLGLPGERELPLSSLPVPPPAADAAAVRASPAAQLYADRVAAIRPGFEVTAETAPSVARICELLEGIPLALELAAGRAHVLSPAELARRLERGIGPAALESRDRSAPARHQTLEAAFSWSLGLLPEPLQAFLARLSVFRGGFTLAAAEAVTGEEACLDRLADLVEVSLVEAVHAAESGMAPGAAPGPGAPAASASSPAATTPPAAAALPAEVDHTRYRMPECLRELAERGLAAEARAELERRHARWFATMAREIAPRLPGAEGRAWLDLLEAEHENLRAMLGWFAAHPEEAGEGLTAASALSGFFTARGHLAEGRAWLDRLLAGSPGPSRERAGALRVAGHLAWAQGQPSRGWFEQSAALWRDLGDAVGLAHALNGLGIAAWEQGELDAAAAAFQEALRSWTEAGERVSAANALSNLGLIALNRGRYAEARARFLEGLAIVEAAADRRSSATALNNLGTVALEEGDLEAAEGYFRRALEGLEAIGQRRTAAYARHNLGSVRLARGDVGQARALQVEALAAFEALGDTRGIANCQRGLAEVARRSGEPARARALYLEALAAGRRAGDLDTALGSLEGLAYLAAGQGARAAAVRVLAGVDALREQLSQPVPASARAERAAHLAALAAAIGDDERARLRASAPAGWEEIAALAAGATA